jgi:hypothetical protein
MPSNYRANGLASWGFSCTCPLCKAPKKVKEESDRNRQRLHEIFYIMSQENTHYDEIVSLTQELIHIMKKERLTRKMGEYYHNLMRIYYEFGDLNSALKYGRRALKYSEAFDDNEGPFVDAVRESVKSLEEWKRTSKP